MSSEGVVRAALELLWERHYPVVVAVCVTALESYPDNVHLRLITARALVALRRDEQAQRELGFCLRQHPNCSLAYRLLGELSLRRDELSAAEIFFREAVRLDPGDPDASDLLAIVTGLLRPTVAAEHCPAPAAAVGGTTRPRLAVGTSAGETRYFGDYLVGLGMLTPDELDAALDYRNATGGRVGDAVVALGLGSQLKVEWAAHAFHARHKSR